jgi:hypothetical protein
MASFGQGVRVFRLSRGAAYRSRAANARPGKNRPGEGGSGTNLRPSQTRERKRTCAPGTLPERLLSGHIQNLLRGES